MPISTHTRSSAHCTMAESARHAAVSCAARKSLRIQGHPCRSLHDTTMHTTDRRLPMHAPRHCMWAHHTHHNQAGTRYDAADGVSEYWRVVQTPARRKSFSPLAWLAINGGDSTGSGHPQTEPRPTADLRHAPLPVGGARAACGDHAATPASAVASSGAEAPALASSLASSEPVGGCRCKESI